MIKEKTILLKTACHTVLINEYGTMLLVWHKVGNLTTRPFIDDNWNSVLSRTGLKSVPKSVYAIIMRNLKHSNNYKNRLKLVS